MHQLTPADNLSVVKEIRRRLSDKANWGAGDHSMLKAPLCVLGHAIDIAGLEKTMQDGVTNYGAFFYGHELSGIADILQKAIRGRGFCAIHHHNDSLHVDGDHAGLLAWLDLAIAMAEAALGLVEVSGIDQPGPLHALRPTFEVKA